MSVETLYRHVTEAPVQENLRDEAARIIDPHAWLLRERALAPYRRGTGSQDAENWLYAVTYGKGFRTAEEVDEWLRLGEPLSEDHTATFHVHFQESLRRADEVIAMLSKRGLPR